jgi:hypothetical protein
MHSPASEREWQIHGQRAQSRKQTDSESSTKQQFVLIVDIESETDFSQLRGFDWCRWLEEGSAVSATLDNHTSIDRSKMMMRSISAVEKRARGVIHLEKFAAFAFIQKLYSRSWV